MPPIRIYRVLYCAGNLPRSADTGVHSVDDMIVQAAGPGAERIKGYMDNTELFRVIVDSLSLGQGQKEAK